MALFIQSQDLKDEMLRFFTCQPQTASKRRESQDALRVQNVMMNGPFISMVNLFETAESPNGFDCQILLFFLLAKLDVRMPDIEQLMQVWPGEFEEICFVAFGRSQFFLVTTSWPMDLLNPPRMQSSAPEFCFIFATVGLWGVDPIQVDSEKKKCR